MWGGGGWAGGEGTRSALRPKASVGGERCTEYVHGEVDRGERAMTELGG